MKKIFFNYGNFPNHKLLRLYGFAIDNNPFDTVEIWAPMSPEAPLYEYKVNVLAEHNISTDVPFELTYGKLCQPLLSALRVQRMEATEFVHLDEVFEGKPASKENETLVVKSLG